MFIVVFNDVGDNWITNSIILDNINTIRFYKDMLYIIVWEKAMWEMVYKYFPDLCALYLRKM